MAALLAIKPLEPFRREDSLFFTCFSGFSLKLRVGDLGGEDVNSSSATEESVGFETETVLVNGAPSGSTLSCSKVGNTGTETDLPCLGVRSGMKGSLRGEPCLLLGSTKSGLRGASLENNSSKGCFFEGTGAGAGLGLGGAAVVVGGAIQSSSSSSGNAPGAGTECFGFGDAFLASGAASSRGCDCCEACAPC